ncbi:MAG: LysR family transcriptional regulator [Woeseiaceae bacterium]|nr:LysR family transcriptional regulator [Woeseiaceae bacterium]
MKLRQIEVFYAVYSSGSMTGAAKMLNVSQPSISKVLAHAEQQLGFLLFERSKGKLISTPEGHTLFKHVASVYQDVDRLRHLARNLRTAESGRIRIASTPALGVQLLPAAIATYRKQNPGIVFEIETLHLEEIYNALTESRVDIGLAFDPLGFPGVEQRQLGSGEFVVIAPAATTFNDASSVDIEELANHPFIALNSRGPLGRLLSTYLATSDAELNVVAWTETYHIAKALVAEGAGIAIVDEITARSSTGGATKTFSLRPTLGFTVAALHRSDAPLSITANNFVSQLQTSISEFLN